MIQKKIPSNIVDIQEEVAVYVTAVLEAAVQAGMSISTEDMHPFPRFIWSVQSPTVCYDIAQGVRPVNMNQDFGHYDLMGLYANTGYAHTDGPTVVLFQTTLYASAREFVKLHYGLVDGMPGYNGKFALVLERLIIIVYTHEMMHWLVHQLLCADGKPLLDARYTNEDEICFHETLAQAFMVYAFRDTPLMQELFADLELGQPLQYKLYSDLGNDFAKIINVFHFMRRDSLQSFEILKRAVQHGVGRDTPTEEETMWVDLLKNPSDHLLAEQAFDTIVLKTTERFPNAALTYRGTIHARRFGII
jgi:hypothetical protein